MAHNAGNPARIGEVFRRQAGAVEVVFKDTITAEELGAIVFAIVQTAREMNVTPGALFSAYYRLDEQRRAAENKVLMTQFREELDQRGRARGT